MLKTIRSYLVSVGYKVDMPSYNEFNGAMAKTDAAMNMLGHRAKSSFNVAGVAMLAFAAAAVYALKAVTVDLAETELRMEIFARRMWMSNEAAMAFKSSLDALDASVQDLYLSPELMDRFVKLREQAYGMELPGNQMGTVMRGIRDITFEWQRFKLEASYAMYWVGYYLTKYLAGPMSNLKGGLKGINDWITQNMPIWTEKVARVLANIYRILHAGGIAIKTIYDYVVRLNPAIKALLAVGVLGWAGWLNPLTLISAALLGILLLIDDYDTYMQGGKSRFAGVWKQLTESGDLKELGETMDNIITELNQLFNLDWDANDNWLVYLLKGLKEAAGLVYNILHWTNQLIGDSKTKPRAKTMEEYMDPSYDQYDAGMPGASPWMSGFPVRSLIQWFKAKTFRDEFNWMNPWTQGSSGTSVAQNNVDVSPTYNIYSSASAKDIAEAVNGKNAALITRATQGMVVA